MTSTCKPFYYLVISRWSLTTMLYLAMSSPSPRQRWVIKGWQSQGMLTWANLESVAEWTLRVALQCWSVQQQLGVMHTIHPRVCCQHLAAVGAHLTCHQTGLESSSWQNTADRLLRRCCWGRPQSTPLWERPWWWSEGCWTPSWSVWHNAFSVCRNHAQAKALSLHMNRRNTLKYQWYTTLCSQSLPEFCKGLKIGQF